MKLINKTLHIAFSYVPLDLDRISEKMQLPEFNLLYGFYLFLLSNFIWFIIFVICYQISWISHLKLDRTDQLTYV